MKRIRNIVGGVCVLIGLVILAVRMSKGMLQGPATMDVVYWSVIFMGIGFGVIFEVDLKIYNWIVDKGCDMVGAPPNVLPADDDGVPPDVPLVDDDGDHQGHA